MAEFNQFIVNARVGTNMSIAECRNETFQDGLFTTRFKRSIAMSYT
ncbi:hypothetical protein JCM19240_6350 [Vibrio maritimus]|uniref:Uncharacterized protein n=1 Tax=Vibrio maritimus TaxID=990268 RepID=A0A090T181_9VIBR|nr:hypothetical protein JCM19240_6350 [Vibrio maritimus]